MTPDKDLDRDAIRERLRAKPTAWRWNTGGTEGYSGVELRDGTLRWFVWSHAPEDGGAHEEILQPTSTFLAEGPPELPDGSPRFVPPPILTALREACAT